MMTHVQSRAMRCANGAHTGSLCQELHTRSSLLSGWHHQRRLKLHDTVGRVSAAAKPAKRPAQQLKSDPAVALVHGYPVSGTDYLLTRLGKEVAAVALGVLLGYKLLLAVVSKLSEVRMHACMMHAARPDDVVPFHLVTYLHARLSELPVRCSSLPRPFPPCMLHACRRCDLRRMGQTCLIICRLEPALVQNPQRLCMPATRIRQLLKHPLRPSHHQRYRRQRHPQVQLAAPLTQQGQRTRLRRPQPPPCHGLPQPPCCASFVH